MVERVKIVISVIIMFLMVSCNIDDGDNSIIDTSSLFETVLGIVGGIDLDLPSTLSSSSVSRANIDYSTLDEVKSEAYGHLMRNIIELEDYTTNINTLMDDYNTLITNNEIAEGDVFTESFTDDATGVEITRKVKYETSTNNEGTEYIIITSGDFDNETNLVDGCYVEISVESDDLLTTGQAMLTGQFSEEKDEQQINISYKTKIVFDQNTDIRSGYFDILLDIDGVEHTEIGQITIVPDSDETENNGVYISTKFESSLWGNHSHVGWANDLVGGVQSLDEDVEADVADEDKYNIYSEYFSLIDGSANVIYREWGTKKPSDIYLDLNEARESTALDGYYNAFQSGADAPEYLIMVFEQVAEPSSFNIYSSSEPNYGDSSTLLSAVNDNPFTIYNLCWYDSAVDEISSGEASYKFQSFVESEGNIELTFERTALVPATTELFGETGFYKESLYPLKYVEGTFESGNTIIQMEELDLNGDDIDESIYFIDGDEDTSWFRPDETGGEKILHIHSFLETYWDQETESVMTETGSPWLLNTVPKYDYNQDGVSDIVYIYDDEKTTIDSKLGNENSNFDSVPLPVFDILGSDWQTITLEDF